MWYKYLSLICEGTYAHSMVADKLNDGWWKRENRETETHTYTGFLLEPSPIPFNISLYNTQLWLVLHRLYILSFYLFYSLTSFHTLKLVTYFFSYSVFKRCSRLCWELPPPVSSSSSSHPTLLFTRHTLWAIQLYLEEVKITLLQGFDHIGQVLPGDNIYSLLIIWDCYQARLEMCHKNWWIWESKYLMDPAIKTSC